MVMIKEVPSGGWQAFTDWGGQLGGTWMREKAAQAVAALPEPDIETMMREVEYWKNKHRELVKAIRDSGVDMDPEYDRSIGAVMWYHDGGGSPSSPLESMALRAALKAHRSTND